MQGGFARNWETGETYGSSVYCTQCYLFISTNGGGQNNLATYSYDSTAGGNYGKGQRTGMTDASGTTAYKYDNRGRLIEEKRTIDGVDYTTTTTYDGAGRIATVTLPTGEVVTSTYNGRGLPDTLSGTAAGDLVTSTIYNQLGQITEINLGNTLRSTFGYYGLGGAYDTTGNYYGKLWEIKTLPQGGGTAIQDVRYVWDANGNMLGREDALVPEVETFTYDFLDRLTAVSGAYTQSYAYNQIGNITSLNGTAYTYGTKPHAVTAVGTTSYVYDANGNMTTRGAQTITWDVENRPLTVTGGASFVYDGDGNRVKKTEGGETTLYVNQYYEKNLTTSVVTTSYYLGSKLIAQREGTTLSYIHQDNLTSSSVMSNSTGTLISSIKYYPFGATRSGSVDTEKKFTSHRFDGTGLYYYGARYYDPAIGRFISPDPLVQATPQAATAMIQELTVCPDLAPVGTQKVMSEIPLINPQEHNRYSNVLNNPLKYCDPSGSWAIFGAIVGAVVGFAAYAFTHRGNFNWGQAALWTAGGALIGAGIGWAAEAIYTAAGFGGVATAGTAGSAGVSKVVNSVSAAAQKIGITAIKFPALEKFQHMLRNAPGHPELYKLFGLSGSLEQKSAKLANVIMDIINNGNYTKLQGSVYEFYIWVDGKLVVVTGWMDSNGVFNPSDIFTKTQ